jgi:hypothetical protein
MMVLASVLLAAASPWHLKVDGEGYLRLLHDGQPAYARELNLVVENGELGANGATFLPAIHVSGRIDSVRIDLMGRVSCNGAVCGRLVLATAHGATPTGDGFYSFSERPLLLDPGEGSAGVIRFGNDSLPAHTKAPSESGGHVSPPVAAGQHGTGAGQAPAKAKPSTDGKVEVLVHVHSEVGYGPFNLGQVAAITGPQDLVTKASGLVIASAPALGIKRILDENSLATLLRGGGIAPTRVLLVCPAGADVVRKAQTVTSQSMIDKALAATQAKFGDKIPLQAAEHVEPFIAPEGELKLDVANPEPVGDGYFVTVTVAVGNELCGTRSFHLVPSAAAERVHRNDPVQVSIVSGPACIVAPGKVLADAYVGQRVQVMIDNIGSKPTLHTGTLISPTQVEVRL